MPQVLHGIEDVLPGTAPEFFPAAHRASRYCLQYRQGREEGAAADSPALPSVTLLPIPSDALPSAAAGASLPGSAGSGVDGAWQALLARHGSGGAATGDGSAVQACIGTYEGEEDEERAAEDASVESPRRVLIVSTTSMASCDSLAHGGATGV